MTAHRQTSIGIRGDDRERQRLTALANLDILDTPPEREFDTVAALAKRLLDCKVALISLIDSERQWFKAHCGLDVSETPREHSFCSRAIQSRTPLLVPDARLDSRFSANPFVTGFPFVRFYAGVPIHAKVGDVAASSVAIGTLCVIDDRPHEIGPQDVRVLQDLAHLVEALIDARSSAIQANKLAEERQAYVHHIDRKQRQFKQAERMANIGSWRLTLADQRTEWSSQVFAIHELPIGEKPPLEDALSFYPPQARAMVSATVARTIETGQPFEFETDFTTAKGNARRVRSIGEVELLDGKPVALIGVFQDITARYQMEQSLRHSASIDDLTQLANRATFNKVLDDDIATALARKQDLALLLIDLDGFKRVNDECGHLVGDEVLQATSAKLRAPYLSDCFVARLGGDEFVLIVSSSEDCADLETIVDRLLADLCQTVTHEGGLVRISGTIGISRLDQTVRNRRELLHRADLALYAAKGERRGSAKFFDDLDEKLNSATPRSYDRSLDVMQL